MTDLADRMLALLPHLRRHARLLSGSQDVGDEYVRLCLEAVLEEPAQIEGEDLRNALFRVFHTIWTAVNVKLDPESPYSHADLTSRLAHGLLELAPVDRRALLLTSLEGFTLEETAEILNIDLPVLDESLHRARERLSHWTAAETLIIEDEGLVAMELEAILKDMGHHVVGIASHVGEAVDLAAARKPGLILSDIELEESESGIDAVQEILGKLEVPVIFVTGYPERLLSGGRTEPAFVVAKPFDPERLKVTIAHVLAMYDSPEVATEHRSKLLAKLKELTGKDVPRPQRS